MLSGYNIQRLQVFNAIFIADIQRGGMAEDKLRIQLLRSLPGIDHLLERMQKDAWFAEVPRSVRIVSAREAIEALRSAILDGALTTDAVPLSAEKVLQHVRQAVSQRMTQNLRYLVNATGVIVHTNLGRSRLAAVALENIQTIAAGYSNLEFDLDAGKRGSRYSAVEDLICEASGAEAAMVVNNNAGAVLLCLDTIAKGKKVIVSRGELVEIGGSFRIPDVMAKSGALLTEVGATNRTHAKDYEKAVDNETGLLLKVHTSNFGLVGFTKSVSLEELVALGEKYRLPVMEDLGSGTFVDFTKYNLIKEPRVQESVAAGVDVVTFSGDKLLGGPQAGIIAGSREILDKIKQNPLTRALRIDKLTLAALESTLRLYRDENRAVEDIPTLNMLTAPPEVLEEKAGRLAAMLKKAGPGHMEIEIAEGTSRAGGGSMPLADLPTSCVRVRVPSISVNRVEKLLRGGQPPIIGRIEEDRFIMDVRTIGEHEFDIIARAFESILQGHAD
jgi:L-seryl-tRNA(Ser) seleniumtransferase